MLPLEVKALFLALCFCDIQQQHKERYLCLRECLCRWCLHQVCEQLHTQLLLLMQQPPQQLLWTRLMTLNMHNMMSHMGTPATAASALTHKQVEWTYTHLKQTGLIMPLLVRRHTGDQKYGKRN